MTDHDSLRAVVGPETRRTPPATLAAALVAAVAGIGPIAKSREVRAGARRFEYAPLEQILDVVRPVLATHGLAVLQDLYSAGEWLEVSTIVLHTSGESMRFGPLRFVAPPGAQDLGALISYGRRYSLLASLGVAPGGEADIDDETDLHSDVRPPASPPRRAGGHESSPPPGGPEGQGVVAGTAPGGGDDQYLERRMAGIDAWRERLAALDGYDVTTRAKQAFVQVAWSKDWHPSHTTLGILEAALKRLEPEVVAAEHDRDGTTVDPPTPEPASQDPYEGWTLAALRAEARRRGLVDAKNLTKLPIVALLHDFDERMADQ